VGVGRGVAVGEEEREGGREGERERERDPALELCSGGGQVCCSALQCIAVHYSAL